AGDIESGGISKQCACDTGRCDGDMVTRSADGITLAVTTGNILPDDDGALGHAIERVVAAAVGDTGRITGFEEAGIREIGIDSYTAQPGLAGSPGSIADEIIQDRATDR